MSKRPMVEKARNVWKPKCHRAETFGNLVKQVRMSCAVLVMVKIFIITYMLNASLLNTELQKFNKFNEVAP